MACSYRVARSQCSWSQIVISVVTKTMKAKGKYKEKQRALLKVWLQKCRNLATLLAVIITRERARILECFSAYCK